MSRLTDALMSLLCQCTPEGVDPSGRDVDQIIECMAAHYNGGRYVVNLTWGSDLSITSDKSAGEVFEAFKSGKNVIGLTSDGMLWQLVQARDGDVLMYSITAYTENSLQYTVIKLPSTAGGKCTKQTISLS